MITLVRSLCFITLLQGVSRGIQISHLTVPVSLAVGDSGLLKCDWDVEGDHVYTLKWYFGQDEFYRWTPLEDPEVKVFPLHHFTVDYEASRRGRVLLHNVTVDAGGSYRCEVSGEAPAFKTSFDTQHMTVVDLPDGAPVIQSSSVEPFQLHQPVTITCLSRHALPPPQLSLYINSQPWEGIYQVLTNGTTGLETAVETLHFHVRPTMAPKGLLRLKCVASYPDLYWMSSHREFTVHLPETMRIPAGRQGVYSVSIGAVPSPLEFCSVVLWACVVAGVRW